MTCGFGRRTLVGRMLAQLHSRFLKYSFGMWPCHLTKLVGVCCNSYVEAAEARAFWREYGCCLDAKFALTLRGLLEDERDLLDDVEIKAQVAHVDEQMAQLQKLVNDEEAEEKKSEIKEMLHAESQERQLLNAANLSRLEDYGSKKDADDDVASVASVFYHI